MHRKLLASFFPDTVYIAFKIFYAYYQPLAKYKHGRTACYDRCWVTVKLQCPLYYKDINVYGLLAAGM